jgi:hypothetical protein
MAILYSISAILADDSLDDESSEDSKCEQIEQLIPRLGWPNVLSELLKILGEDRRRRDYEVAAEVLWGAALDARDLPVNRVIALLYYRFDPSGDSEDNLVWSITSKLKRVDYLSEYDPVHDPAVQAELAVIKAG